MPELILQQPSCDIAMMRAYASAGWRNVMLNLELSPFGEAQVVAASVALHSVGAATFLKLADLQPEAYARYLHFGIRTFILPHVDSAASVQAVRTRLASVFWVDQDSIRLFPLVESRAGLRNLDAICAVEGVTGVMVGPFDLGHDLGFSFRDIGEFNAARHELAPVVLDALAAIRDCGKPNGCGLTPAWLDIFPLDRIDWLWLQLTDIASIDAVGIAARAPRPSTSAESSAL